VLVGVRLRDDRAPEAFVATAQELKAKFRHHKTDNNRWSPFSREILRAHLNRWDKLEAFIGQGR
jgi:hypothetical protein